MKLHSTKNTIMKSLDESNYSTAVPPVVGLSLELGTTIINHVVPGTTALADLRLMQKNLPSSFRILQRGHVVCSVDGIDVNAQNIADVLSDGPIGSKVVVLARNESGQEYEVDLVRQNAQFVEHIKRIEEIIHVMNRDIYGSSLPLAKARHLEIEKELEQLALVASHHEQMMMNSNLLLRERIMILESSTQHCEVADEEDAGLWKTVRDSASNPSETDILKKLESDNASLSRKASSLEVDIKRCHEDKEKLIAEMLKSSELHREYEAAWRSEKEAISKKMQEMEEIVQKDGAAALALSETKQKANSLLKQRDADLTAARQKIEKLEKEVSDHNASARDLRQRISVLEQNRLLLARDANAAQSAKQQEEKVRLSLEQSFWRVGVLEKESLTLQAALDKATKQVYELQIQFKERVATLTKEKEAALSELAQTKLKANSLLAQKSDEETMLRVKLEALEIEVCRLNRDNRNTLAKSSSDLDLINLKSKINLLEKEKGDLQLMNESKYKNVTRLEENISALESALENQRASNISLQLSLDQALKQMQAEKSSRLEIETKLRKENEALVSEISEIRRKANDIIAVKSEDICLLNKKFEHLEKAHGRVTADCAASENRRISLEKESANLSREIVHLQQEIRTAKSKEEGLISQIASLKNDTMKLKEKEKLMDRTLDAVRASQVSVVKELQELREVHSKLRSTAASRENVLQAALDASNKLAKEASERERANAAIRDKERVSAASELSETKHKANSLLAKKSEELACIRGDLDRAEKEIGRLRAEHEKLRRQWTEKIKEKDNECALLSQRAKELADCNVRLVEQRQYENSVKLSNINCIKPNIETDVNATRSENPQNRFEQTLLHIRIEALQTQNASIESERDRLLKSLLHLQQSQGANDSSKFLESNLEHSESQQLVQIEALHTGSNADLHNHAPDERQLTENRIKVPKLDDDFIRDLQGQLRDAQLARDSAFKVMDVLLDNDQSLIHGDKQALDTTISEALAQQIAAETANQELMALIAKKDSLLQASHEAKQDVDRQYGALAESKERLEIELTQAVKTAENFERQSAALTSEIQDMKKASAVKENIINERDLLIETLRSRCRDFEENLTCSVLNLQEKESQNRSLSTSLIDSQNHLERQVEATNAEVYRIKLNLIDTERQKERCEAENLELTEKCRHLETQLHNLSEILIESQQRWESEIDTEREKHTILENRCSEAQRELSDAHDSVRDLQNEFNLAQARSKEFENSLALASAKEEALIQEIKILEEKLERLELLEKHQLPQLVGKCKSLEAHTQQLSEILVESQGRWESEMAAANIKLSSVETKLSEAQNASRLSDSAAKESVKVAQSLRARISELEQLVHSLTEKQASNQHQIQEQEDHITKLLVIEKKRLETIHNHRAALKEAEERSLLLKKEMQDLKSRLEMAQARDASLSNNIDQLKAIGQEKQTATQNKLLNEIQSVREELKSANLRIEQLLNENSFLKAEVIGLKQERAPWPSAISGYKSKADRMKTATTSLKFLGEADTLRMQLDAVEKLAAERTEQVRNLERQVGYFEGDEVAECDLSQRTSLRQHQTRLQVQGAGSSAEAHGLVLVQDENRVHSQQMGVQETEVGSVVGVAQQRLSAPVFPWQYRKGLVQGK